MYISNRKHRCYLPISIYKWTQWISSIFITIVGLQLLPIDRHVRLSVRCCSLFVPRRSRSPHHYLCIPFEEDFFWCQSWKAWRIESLGCKSCIQLEILKSLGGFYDGLAFSLTRLNRLHVSYNTLPLSTLLKDIHYQCCMLLSFIFYGSHFCQSCKLFYIMECPQEGVTYFNILSPNTHLLGIRLMTENFV